MLPLPGLAAGGPMRPACGPWSCLARYGFWKPLGGTLLPCRASQM